ncbi:hypothetical protein AFLA70_891g000011 [Aspergillus flavus AF70]|nr:hypothetical protein AFLA70_891g000011 [Aspergillus flavus AF70]
MADGSESKTSKGRHSKEIEAGSWVGRMSERFIYEV